MDGEQPMPVPVGIVEALQARLQPDAASAHNDDQMLSLVSKALQSEQTMAIILSLIAKSNEVNASSSPSNAIVGNADSTD